MLMLRLSANPMSNGASLAVKPGSTPVWYAYHTGVLACTFGSRTEKTCRELLALLMPFNIGTVITDD